MALKTVTAEDEGLAEMIKDTEFEIMDHALGNKPLDNDGDKSLEEMGDGLEGDDVAEEDDGPDDEGDEGSERDETNGGEPDGGDAEFARDNAPAQTDARQQQDRPGMVPSGRLREVRESKDAEINALRAEFEAFKAGVTQQRPVTQQEQAKPAEPPDMFADPDGFRRHVIEQANQAATFRHVESSLSDAAETHGEKFQAAYNEVQRIGATEKQQFGNSPTVNRIWTAPNPGKALMSWHAQQQTIKEVGNDPNAWLERKLEERLSDPAFLATAVERARGSARQNGARSYPPSRMPPSLNSQTGSSHQVDDPDLYDNSEASVFAFANK